MNKSTFPGISAEELVDIVTPAIREGAKLIQAIPDGWSAKLLPNGDCVIAHPEHPPRLLHRDGTSEELKPDGA